MHTHRHRNYRKPQWILMSLLLLLALTSCSNMPVTKSTSTPAATHSTLNSSTTTKPFPNASQIDTYLSQLAEKGNLTGSVLVSHNGMVFSKGYGPADKDLHIPNTARTRFRIGSNTKQFTAMGILILQERGKLHVQDHICLYIPNCPRDWQSITLQQLLIHTSGIPDYTNFPDFAVTWNNPVTPEQLIERFKNRPLNFPPGKKWSYSNSGYVLLGYIIERVSGQSYASFLQQNIFTPLNMRDTGYDSSSQHLPEHATGYYAGYIKPEPYNIGVVYAAGALYSSVQDLNIWDQALERHQFVSQAALQDMFTPHIPCPAGGCLLHTDLGYGYGWFIAGEPLGKLVYHLGRIDGFFTFNGFYPTQNIDVVVLSNLEGTDALKIARTLASMVSRTNH